MASSPTGIPILTYHKIDYRNEWGLNTVKPFRFRQQMEFLKENGYSPITFHHLLNNNLPDKPIIITFDDGYESVYTNAFPVLKAFSFPAVIFIISGYIGSDNTWDVNLGGLHFRHLDEHQIRDMAKSGMEIGSHGITHRSLTDLSDEELKAELTTSRLFLIELTDQSVLSLAYPFGMLNDSVIRIAREAGFRYGCRNLWGRPKSDQLMVLKRIPVYRTDSIGAFSRKLTPGWRYTLESTKLRAISWSARLTPMYQRLLKKTADSATHRATQLQPKIHKSKFF